MNLPKSLKLPIYPRSCDVSAVIGRHPSPAGLGFRVAESLLGILAVFDMQTSHAIVPRIHVVVVWLSYSPRYVLESENRKMKGASGEPTLLGTPSAESIRS